MLATDEKLGTARLIERRRWTPRHLSFRLTRDPAYRFVPGQFARLGLRKPNGSPVWRASCAVPVTQVPTGKVKAQ